MTTAELIQSTKSAFDWTRNNLGPAYDINMITDGVATFFGNPNLPVPSKFHLSVRRFSSMKTTLSMGCKTRTIDSAFPISTMRSWIHLDWCGWFSCPLLRMLGYNKCDCYIRRWKDIPLFICGGDVCTTINVCIISPWRHASFSVQEDKGILGKLSLPETQLTVGAIAAFQVHNMHHFVLGLSNTANQRTTPCIVMNGSMPTFYKTNNSVILVRAVERAQYRTHPTTVHKLTPPVERLRLVPGWYEVAQQ